MSDLTLRKIDVPDLGNTYYAPQLDNTLATAFSTVSTYAVGDLVVYNRALYRCTTAVTTAGAWNASNWTAVAMSDELSSLKQDFANFPNGVYPNMVAGGLVGDSYTEDKIPYLFRKSHSGKAQTGSIVGGTVAWNQLINSASIPATKTESDVTFTNNGDGTITVNGTATADVVYAVNSMKTWAEHKYMICGCPKGGSETTYNFAMRGMGMDRFDFGNGNIWDATGNTWKGAVIYIKSGATVTNLVFKPQIFDLTQMFGSTIADYIYTLESATTGAGVAKLKSWGFFTDDYYAYNTGSLESVSGLSAREVVGFNQWDEEWELGTFDASGNPSSSSTTIRSANYIQVLPNTAYFTTATSGQMQLFYYDKSKVFINSAWFGGSAFTTPTNCYYMKFRLGSTYGTTYNNDICINISGSRNGEYEAYKKTSYALDASVTLRGVFKLDANNNLYADGDVYYPSEGIGRRYNIVDLGTLDWTYTSPRFSAVISDAPLSGTRTTGLICPKYVSKMSGESYDSTWDKVCYFASATLYIHDSAYTDAATFKTAMSGKYLVYELATPTTETADAYEEYQIVEADGTEQFVSTGIVPVGHDTKYFTDLGAKAETIPDAPTTDGTYTLTCTVASGVPTYTWA